jgi:hypothetical protein
VQGPVDRRQAQSGLLRDLAQPVAVGHVCSASR